MGKTSSKQDLKPILRESNSLPSVPSTEYDPLDSESYERLVTENTEANRSVYSAREILFFSDLASEMNRMSPKELVSFIHSSVIPHGDFIAIRNYHIANAFMPRTFKDGYHNPKLLSERKAVRKKLFVGLFRRKLRFSSTVKVAVLRENL